MKKLPLLGIFTLILFFVGVTSFGAKAQKTQFKIDYEKYTLPNGLDVILHKDNSDPIVSVAIQFHVGSNREKQGRTGFAHFFEHMLFQNSENVGKGNFFKIIEDLGGTFNGGTWNDGTIYYEVVPKDALEKILWMESDRMGFMINTVTVPVFENEKQVVKNEKRQRVDNVPYGHTNYVIDKAMFPSDHPYNWQVIGSLEDLQNATIADVKEFYNKYYGMSNATLVIAGDIDFKQVKTLVDKYFSEISSGPAVEKITPRIPKLDSTKKFYHEDNFATLPELTLVWPTVEDQNPDRYALDYLAQILTDGKRAPFYKELVENQDLAPNVIAYNNGMELAGKFFIRVRPNEGVDLNKVHAALFKAMDDFEKNGIDDRDMDRIKNALEKDFYSGISSILNKSFQLCQYNEFTGSPDNLAKEIEKILAVKKEDVMNVYKKYIKGKNYIATSFVPKGKLDLILKGSQKAEVVEEPVVQGAEAPPMEEEKDNSAIVKTPSKIDRTKAPALGEAPTVTPPKIWSTNFKNGLTAYGIQNAELPMVEFSIRMKGGMLFDNIDKVGVANLITDLMMEGTKNKTPEQLQDAIGQLGATINMYTTSEYIELSANCLARNYDAVMALMKEILLEPRWDAKEFDRVKQATITTIQQRASQPNVVAQQAFNKVMYGSRSILSNMPMGTVESVESITLDDLKSFYKNYFTPTLASFNITGAIDENKAKASLEPLVNDWKRKEVKLPEVALPSTSEKPIVYFVDIPSAKQSVVQLGLPAVKGNDKDYFPLTIVNQRLGDGSAGRLFQILREEKGYTYGAYSSIPRRINQSFFVASASVRSNVTKESVQTFKDIISDYGTSFSQEDLDKTKVSTFKGNALAYETLGDKLGILQNISTYGLPIDYIKQNEDILSKMSLTDAKSYINKYVNPKKMVYFVTGDAKSQLERVKELGIGDVILIDKNGNPISTKP
ncbi:MAG: insulinase family protein [Saprospiraceae bacterium]|nr:insulinase family protein [Saprospiraceae bacterium]